MSSQRKGKKWSDEEDAQLMKELYAGVPISAIARNHFRTELGINFRIKKIAVDMVAAGKPTAEITRVTKLSADDIAEAIAEHGEVMEKREQTQAKRMEKEQKRREKAAKAAPQLEELLKVMQDISQKLDKK